MLFGGNDDDDDDEDDAERRCLMLRVGGSAHLAHLDRRHHSRGSGWSFSSTDAAVTSGRVER